jgi:hypothetical protein
MNPLDIKNFIPPPKNKKLPRYSQGVKKCCECGRPTGKLMQTSCNNPLCNCMKSEKTVCVNCRKDEQGNNGFRNKPYICSHCKNTQSQWLNTQAENIIKKIITAQNHFKNKQNPINIVDEIFDDINN